MSSLLYFIDKLGEDIHIRQKKIEENNKESGFYLDSYYCDFLEILDDFIRPLVTLDIEFNKYIKEELYNQTNKECPYCGASDESFGCYIVYGEHGKIELCIYCTACDTYKYFDVSYLLDKLFNIFHISNVEDYIEVMKPDIRKMIHDSIVSFTREEKV